jgi:hypothetical protein
MTHAVLVVFKTVLTLFCYFSVTDLSTNVDSSGGRCTCWGEYGDVVVGCVDVCVWGGWVLVCGGWGWRVGVEMGELGADACHCMMRSHGPL